MALVAAHEIGQLEFGDTVSPVLQSVLEVAEKEVRGMVHGSSLSYLDVCGRVPVPSGGELQE